MEELRNIALSTYAPDDFKIMEENRGYVVKESREGVKRNYQVLKLKSDKISSAMLSAKRQKSTLPDWYGYACHRLLIEHLLKSWTTILRQK